VPVHFEVQIIKENKKNTLHRDYFTIFIVFCVFDKVQRKMLKELNIFFGRNVFMFTSCDDTLFNLDAIFLCLIFIIDAVLFWWLIKRTISKNFLEFYTYLRVYLFYLLSLFSHARCIKFFVCRWLGTDSHQNSEADKINWLLDFR